MCRFYSVDLFDQNWLKSFDYYMRLDTDSAILSNLLVDPFLLMKKKDAYYGYHSFCMENSFFVNNLLEWYLELWQLKKENHLTKKTL